MTIGVNFFGPTETDDGIGRAAALNLECFREAGLDVHPILLSRPVARERGKGVELDDALLRSLPHRANYFHFSARWVPYYFAKLSQDSLKSFYNIGFWVCETPDFPEEWARQLVYFNEIWTASNFCLDSISRVSDRPAVRIPHFIEFEELTQRMVARGEGFVEEPFTFLTVANVYSDIERKNVWFGIECFKEAFGDDPNVRYILKLANEHMDDATASMIRALQSSTSNVAVRTGFVPRDDIASLYDNADVYVSLHRAEGFGLTISDAIARGIPVIATGYSGNTDFCDPRHCYTVRYRLEPVGHERLRYRSTDLWAAPDRADSVIAFRTLKGDYSRYLVEALALRANARREFSKNAIARKIRRRLDLIARSFDFANDLSVRPAIDATFGTYRR